METTEDDYPAPPISLNEVQVNRGFRSDLRKVGRARSIDRLFGGLITLIGKPTNVVGRASKGDAPVVAIPTDILDGVFIYPGGRDWYLAGVDGGGMRMRLVDGMADTLNALWITVPKNRLYAAMGGYAIFAVDTTRINRSTMDGSVKEEVIKGYKIEPIRPPTAEMVSILAKRLQN